jgi:hypothetical protein
MAEATTYNISGIREDLTDFLTILEPEETPKLSSFTKSVRPTQTYQEWQVDNLATPSFPGVLDGSDVTVFNNKAANRQRIGNYVQWWRQPWMVSRITEAVEIAGVANEVANAKEKCMRELKRSVEATIGSDQDRQADNGTVPYLSRGLGTWISSSGPADVNAAFRTPANSVNTTATASLTEDLTNQVFQSQWEAVGNRRNLDMFVGPTLKRTISKFQRQEGTTTAKSYEVMQDATEHQIDLRVDMYESDFGSITVHLDAFNGIITDATLASGFITTQSRVRGYCINPELVGFGYLIGMESVELPDQGGGKRGFVHCVGVLMCKNPKGLAKFSATS